MTHDIKGMYTKRIILIGLLFNSILCLNCKSKGSDLTDLSDVIQNNIDLKSYGACETYIDNDTFFIKLKDTSTIKSDLLTELRSSYLLFSIRQEIGDFSSIDIETFFPNMNNFFYNRHFTKEELKQYFNMFYINNKPFQDFSNYVVTKMNAYEIVRLDVLIYDINEMFDNVNYHKSFIDLVFDYSKICNSSREGSQLEKDLIISMSALLRFGDADLNEKQFLSYLLDYCGIPPTSDSTIVRFPLKNQNQ